MEYSLHWVGEGWIRVGHADFMLFVSISFALGGQRKRGFWWNMGLKFFPYVVKTPVIYKNKRSPANIRICYINQNRVMSERKKDLCRRKTQRQALDFRRVYFVESSNNNNYKRFM